MASREPVYLPQVSPSQLVPVDPSDNAIYRQRVNLIKGLINELEDIKENNLIAYKIAKTRRRIEDKKARLAAQQAVEQPRGFWGSSSRSNAASEDVKSTGGSATKKKAKPRPKKDGPRSRNVPPAMSIEGVIPPITSEELSHLRGSPAQADRVDTASETAESVTRKPSGKSLKAKSERRQSPAADSMDVDDFDDY